MQPVNPRSFESTSLEPNPDYRPAVNLASLPVSSRSEANAEPVRVVVVQNTGPNARTVLCWILAIALGSAIGATIGVRFGLQWSVQSAADATSDAWNEQHR